MLSAMKKPFAGILLAGVAAVLPTVIVARLSAESTPPPATPANTPAADPPANASQDFTEPTTRPTQSDGQPEGASAGSTDNGGPSGAPNRAPDASGGTGRGGGFFGGEGRNRSAQFGAGPYARGFEDIQLETQESIAFFKQNSPNRMAYFVKLPENSQARRLATWNLLRLYRPIQNFKETSPKLYDLLVQQVQLRDQAFEFAKEQKDADLREKAAEIVNVSIQARSMRLDILKHQLDEQEQQLAAYKSNTDSAAEQEVTAIKNDEQHLLDRVEKLESRQHTSMLDFDPAADPLADAAPISPAHPSDDESKNSGF